MLPSLIVSCLVTSTAKAGTGSMDRLNPSNRRVCEATPVTPDHRVVGMRADGAAAAMVTIGNVIKNFDRWPAGGELAACVGCVPFEDLLLLTNHSSARVVEFVKKRFTRGT